MVDTRAEEYIETIYEVVQRKGYAKVTDVAHLLDVGLSAVTEMFQKLSDKGYINYEKYSGVTLTKKGEKIAQVVLAKYEEAEVEEVDILSETARGKGGFGSTGLKKN